MITIKIVKNKEQWYECRECGNKTTRDYTLCDMCGNDDWAKTENSTTLVRNNKTWVQLEQGIYRHFKGNKYHLLTSAINANTNEQMVVYQAMYGNGRVYVRPYGEFFGKVDNEKHPDTNQEERFKYICKPHDYELQD